MTATPPVPRRRGFNLPEMFLGPDDLRWLADLLAVLREFGCGWALWNFRGSFGVLDSTRSDVAYEDWHGCPLDRALLNLLQKS